MSMKKPTVRDCIGCHDDFYNHNAMGLNEKGGVCQCWHLAEAQFVRARDVPTNMPPPYKGIRLTTRPNCYHRPYFVRVKPDQLTTDGFWKS